MSAAEYHATVAEPQSSQQDPATSPARYRRPRSPDRVPSSTQCRRMLGEDHSIPADPVLCTLAGAFIIGQGTFPLQGKERKPDVSSTRRFTWCVLNIDRKLVALAKSIAWVLPVVMDASAYSQRRDGQWLPQCCTVLGPSAHRVQKIFT